MTNTEQYIRQLVEEEFEKSFVRNVVEIASKVQAPGFTEMLIEETVDYLVYRRLKELSDEDEVQNRLNKCKQIYDDMIQTKYGLDTWFYFMKG